jgi:homoserine kinase type II
VARASDGSTVQEAQGRAWDLCQWMPGQPRSPARVSSAHVVAACAAIAQLHVIWSLNEQHFGPCQAVARRLTWLAEWDLAVRSGWRPTFENASDPVALPAERAWRLLPPCLDLTRRLLAPLRDVPYRQHPCLGDVWHDHVLFVGDRVSGVIDYGAARVDTPAADLARLLGSLAPKNNEYVTDGLRHYRASAPLRDEEVALVHVLDYTGTILSAANWLFWLYHEGRAFADRRAVATRLAALVERLERTHKVTLPLLR